MTNKPAKQDLKTLVLSSVINKVRDRQLTLPPNYSVENALQSAWFIISDMKLGKNQNYKPVLESVSQESVAFALFKMCTDGLNPAKNQCAFIARGNQLTYERQYAGSEALAKRFSGVQSIKANVIHKGDVFVVNVMPDGRKTLGKHETTLENQDHDIIGAYCVIIDRDGLENMTVMTMKQIHTSWDQSPSQGQEVHKKFPEEMCKKTVIKKACKPYINSSDDEVYYHDEYNHVSFDSHKLPDNVVSFEKETSKAKEEFAKNDTVIHIEAKEESEQQFNAEEI